MNVPKATLSPHYKNVNVRPKQSPQEIKERIRQNYKTKIQNCRNVLLDKFRGEVNRKNVDDIKELYKSILNFSNETIKDEEESTVFEELKSELLQEEIQWWLNENEKCEMEGIDWSSIEEDNNVLCPVCQKENITMINGHIICSRCETTIKTEKSLIDIKKTLFSDVELHNTACSNEAQFTVITDPNGSEHLYFICQNCNEMKLIL